MTYVLVDEDNSNVFSFLSKGFECFLDRRGFGLRIYHEKVPLGVGGICDMLY
jgi:hypothetical protein